MTSTELKAKALITTDPPALRVFRRPSTTPAPAVEAPPPARQIVAAVRNAHHAYGERQVLKGLNMTLAAGEIYTLLGPNGAGKSTLMKALCGRMQLNRGQVRIAGGDPATKREARQRVGFVPQNIALYGHLTVQENLSTFARLSGLGRKPAKLAVERLLVQAGLTDRAHQITRTLSGGYQRRVNIAIAMLHEPEVLILDEPTVGIDVDAREKIHALLFDVRNAGTAVLLTTHDLEQAEAVSDRVGLLREGVLIAEGPPKEIVDVVFGSTRELIVLLARAPEQIGQAALELYGLRQTQSPLTWLGVASPEGIDIPRMQVRFASAGLHVKEIRARAPDLSSLFFKTYGEGVLAGSQS
jgi:ABC-2 type transport system ATP-binding protein